MPRITLPKTTMSRAVSLMGRYIRTRTFHLPDTHRRRGIARIGIGGRCEIRTHEGYEPLPVFKTGALNRSANLPLRNVVPVETGTQPIHASALRLDSRLRGNDLLRADFQGILPFGVNPLKPGHTSHTLRGGRYRP